MNAPSPPLKVRVTTQTITIAWELTPEHMEAAIAAYVRASMTDEALEGYDVSVDLRCDRYGESVSGATVQATKTERSEDQS